MSVLVALLFGLFAIRATVAFEDGIPPQPVTQDDDSADVDSEATSVTFDGTLLTAVQWAFAFNKAREKFFRGRLGFWEAYGPRVADTFEAIFDTDVFNLTTLPAEFEELKANGLMEWDDAVTGVGTASIKGSFMISYKTYRGDTDSLPAKSVHAHAYSQLEAEEQRWHALVGNVEYSFDSVGKVTLAKHTLLDSYIVDDQNAAEEKGITLFSSLRKQKKKHKKNKKGFVGSVWWWTLLSAAAFAVMAIAYYYYYTYGQANKKYTHIGYGSAADALLI